MKTIEIVTIHDPRFRRNVLKTASGAGCSVVEDEGETMIVTFFECRRQKVEFFNDEV